MNSSIIILQQMVVLFCMMTIGYFIYKKEWIDDDFYKKLSKLVVNIFNPVLVINGVVDRSGEMDPRLLRDNLILVCIYFVVMIFVGWVGCRILKANGKERCQYQLMYVFSNVGFMGIPVMTGLFGNDCLIYITFYILGYNLLLYSYGVSIAKKSGGHGGKIDKNSLKGLWNPGVVAALLAIAIFVLRIPVPSGVATFCDYVGNVTIPLSMIVIGISVAKMPLKDIFTGAQTYLFCGVKLLVVPILMALIFKPLVQNEMLYMVFVLMFAMPVGSIVTMIANEYGEGETVCSQGIVLSTILSLITIPMVTFIAAL